MTDEEVVENYLQSISKFAEDVDKLALTEHSRHRFANHLVQLAKGISTADGVDTSDDYWLWRHGVPHLTVGEMQ